ncbi:MAG TPA: 3-dehydroquinate synthase [Beijerinckiaceae bacterium]|nr:3-dehydroquinate synthase [Beijerinckiaceae bacterium]
MSAPFFTVPVALAGRSYDIRIGRNLIDTAGDEIARLVPGARAAIITDQTVAGLHLDRLTRSLASAGIAARTLVLKQGEATKNWTELGHVVEALLADRLERRDIVVAFGGGVIGDLAGFAAAIVRRGMAFVQIPTTLLAQVDSSVGGKTAVNSPHGKNLVGAFHQPILVLADTALLDTLSAREFRAGYAEVVKYGLIDQPAFFDWLEAGHWRGILDGSADREEAVRISCAAKAAVVARDETETGDRALLNLGHTFGHALEAVTGYNSARLVHGEGVAIGIALAHRFSQRLGLCTGQDALRVSRHLQAVGLPTRLQDVPGGVGSADELMAAIRQDKKVSRGALTFILTRGIGQSFIARTVDPGAVVSFLTDELNERTPQP